MSAEAARIISKISGRKPARGLEIMLGTIKAVSPFTVKFDNVGFDVSAGLLVNAEINFHEGFVAGDRVAGVAVGGTQYVILCKVVSV